MTTIRGTIKNGQLVFDAEELRGLGLTEGQTLELPAEVLVPVEQAGAENPFLKWIGAFPPFEDGQTAVGFTRELRGGDDDIIQP